MRIVCTNCGTGYEVRAETIGTGRKVRCAACATTWFAVPEPEPDPAATPEPPAPEIIPPTRAETATEARATTVEAEPPAAPARQGARLVGRDVESDARRGRRTTGGRKAKKAGDGSPGHSTTGWLILSALAATLALVFAFRVDVVRAVPDLASLFALTGQQVNVRGMAFEDLATTIEFDNGQPVAIVSGRVRNLTTEVKPLPRLRVAVRDRDGREVMTQSVAPPRPTLAVGGEATFRTRLTGLPQTGNEVEVRFLASRDLGPGGPR